MGYANGVRAGHAAAHLRDPMNAALEDAAYSHGREWWTAWGSRESARELVGKLWHCTDVVPRSTRQAASEVLGLNDEWAVGTYAQLSRRLRADLQSGR